MVPPLVPTAVPLPGGVARLLRLKRPCRSSMWPRRPPPSIGRKSTGLAHKPLSPTTAPPLLILASAASTPLTQDSTPLAYHHSVSDSTMLALRWTETFDTSTIATAA